METQISLAIKASKELVKTLHRDGLDRGCIVSFNDYMKVRQNFTENERSLYRSLNGLNDAAGGDTRLYDSIVDVIQKFHSSGDPTRPWILVVVTDGVDNCSSRSLHNCAQEISRLFTKNSSNYLFLVGVGDGVNQARMEEMASKGNFTYFPVEDFFLLELIFLAIANKITTSLSVSLGSLTVGNSTASWAEVQKHRKLSQVAIDYALLIDVSTSMKSRVKSPNNRIISSNSRAISSNSVTNPNSVINVITQQPPPYFDSRIIGSTDAALLASWIDNIHNSNASSSSLRLIYRASRDGFGIDRFHYFCDNRGPTIVVIKVKYSGEIIGGYNPLEWSSVRINETSTLLPNNHNYYNDQPRKTSKSFIFSLTNRGLSRVTSNNNAIIWSRNRGPCFGLEDLCILPNKFGISRQHSYEYRIINRENFEIEEYEVFQVIGDRPAGCSICAIIGGIFTGIYNGIVRIITGICCGILWIILGIFSGIVCVTYCVAYLLYYALYILLALLPLILYFKHEIIWAIDHLICEKFELCGGT